MLMSRQQEQGHSIDGKSFSVMKYLKEEVPPFKFDRLDVSDDPMKQEGCIGAIKKEAGMDGMMRDCLGGTSSQIMPGNRVGESGVKNAYDHNNLGEGKLGNDYYNVKKELAEHSPSVLDKIEGMEIDVRRESFKRELEDELPDIALDDLKYSSGNLFSERTNMSESLSYSNSGFGTSTLSSSLPANYNNCSVSNSVPGSVNGCSSSRNVSESYSSCRGAPAAGSESFKSFSSSTNVSESFGSCSVANSTSESSNNSGSISNGHPGSYSNSNCSVSNSFPGSYSSCSVSDSFPGSYSSCSVSNRVPNSFDSCSVSNSVSDSYGSCSVSTTNLVSYNGSVSSNSNALPSYSGVGDNSSGSFNEVSGSNGVSYNNTQSSCSVSYSNAPTNCSVSYSNGVHADCANYTSSASPSVTGGDTESAGEQTLHKNSNNSAEGSASGSPRQSGPCSVGKTAVDARCDDAQPTPNSDSREPCQDAGTSQDSSAADNRLRSQEARGEAVEDDAIREETPEGTASRLNQEDLGSDVSVASEGRKSGDGSCAVPSASPKTAPSSGETSAMGDEAEGEIHDVDLVEASSDPARAAGDCSSDSATEDMKERETKSDQDTAKEYTNAADPTSANSQSLPDSGLEESTSSAEEECKVADGKADSEIDNIVRSPIKTEAVCAGSDSSSSPHESCPNVNLPPFNDLNKSVVKSEPTIKSEALEHGFDDVELKPGSLCSQPAIKDEKVKPEPMDESSTEASKNSPKPKADALVAMAGLSYPSEHTSSAMRGDHTAPTPMEVGGVDHSSSTSRSIHQPITPCNTPAPRHDGGASGAAPRLDELLPAEEARLLKERIRLNELLVPQCSCLVPPGTLVIRL